MQDTGSQPSQSEKYWWKPFDQQDYRYRINSSQQPKNLERDLIDPSIKIKEEQMKFSQRKARKYEESFRQQQQSFKANNIKNLEKLQTFDCRNCSSITLDIDNKFYQLNLIDKTIYYDLSDIQKQPLDITKYQQVQQIQAEQQNQNDQQEQQKILNTKELIDGINKNLSSVIDSKFSDMINQINNLQISENQNQQYLIQINNNLQQQQQPSNLRQQPRQSNEFNAEQNQFNVTNYQRNNDQVSNHNQYNMRQLSDDEENLIEDENQFNFQQQKKEKNIQNQGSGCQKQKPSNIIPQKKQKDQSETIQNDLNFDKEIQQQIIISQLLNANRLLPYNQQKTMKQILEEAQKQLDKLINQHSAKQMLNDQSNQLQQNRGVVDIKHQLIQKRRQVKQDFEEMENSYESDNVIQPQTNETDGDGDSDEQYIVLKHDIRGNRKLIIRQKGDYNDPTLNKRSKFTQRNSQIKQTQNQILEQPYEVLDLNNLNQFDFQNYNGLSKCKNQFQLHILEVQQDIQKVKTYYFNRFHLELQQFVISKIEHNNKLIILLKISRQLYVSLQQLKDNFNEAYIYPGILNEQVFKQCMKYKYDYILVNRQTIHDSKNQYKIQNIQSDADKYRLNGFGLLLKYSQVDDYQYFLDSLEECYLISYIKQQQKTEKAIIVYLVNEQILYIFYYSKKGYNSICRDVFYDQRLEYIQTLQAECEMANAIKLFQGMCETKKTIWIPYEVKFNQQQVFNNLYQNFEAYQLNYYHIDHNYLEIIQQGQRKQSSRKQSSSQQSQVSKRKSQYE